MAALDLTLRTDILITGCAMFCFSCLHSVPSFIELYYVKENYTFYILLFMVVLHHISHLSVLVASYSFRVVRNAQLFIIDTITIGFDYCRNYIP